MLLDTDHKSVVLVATEEWEAHKQRVEQLCDLVTSMMKGLVDTPFGAMLPPDIVKQARSL